VARVTVRLETTSTVIRFRKNLTVVVYLYATTHVTVRLASNVNVPNFKLTVKTRRRNSSLSVKFIDRADNLPLYLVLLVSIFPKYLACTYGNDEGARR
jgi:hypothetical protein